MRRASLNDLDENGQRGDWAFLKDNTQIAIRYGVSAFAGTVIIPIALPNKQNWQWNGDFDKPTISPSILVHPVENFTAGWHGFLREGKLVEA